MSAPEYPQGQTQTADLEQKQENETLNEPDHADGVKEKEESLASSSSATESPVLDPNDPPDGGLRAWLVVFGGACGTFTTFGYVNSWGVFQSYYQEDLLRNTPPSNIAWIGSIQYALVFLPGLLAGRLFDLGYDRLLFTVCGTILVIATFLVAQCKEYWQFLICQGFLVGLASGGMMNPIISVMTHWFKKKRQLALGLVAIGSSLGGTVIPILARNLIPKIGFAWTMRVIGFVHIFTIGLIMLTLRRRLPVVNKPGGLFNFAAFKSPQFSVYCLSTLVSFLGIYTVLTYIDISATSIGVDPDFAFYLVAIANASSGVGRYFAGAVADGFGPMNTMIPFTANTAILTYAWPYARSKGSLIAIAVLYGFSSGSYVTLIGSPVMEFGELEDVGRRVGMMFTILSIGAVAGPPISGAIGSATGGFVAVGYYAGTMILLGVGLMLLTRHLVLRQVRGKM